MKLAIASTSLLAMSSAVAAFSSITRRQFRNGISSHAARNVASIFTASAYLAPTPVFAGIGRSTESRFKSSLSMAEKGERPFKTWTFDNSCDTMEFNRLISATMSVGGDLSVVDDSDMVVLGIYGPPKESNDDDDDDEEEKSENDSVPEPSLTGKAKELDEELGGALTEILIENYKAFQHGGKAGSTTPVVRLASKDTKVSGMVRDEDHKERNVSNFSVNCMFYPNK